MLTAGSTCGSTGAQGRGRGSRGGRAGLGAGAGAACNGRRRKGLATLARGGGGCSRGAKEEDRSRHKGTKGRRAGNSAKREVGAEGKSRPWHLELMARIGHVHMSTDVGMRTRYAAEDACPKTTDCLCITLHTQKI